MPSTASPTAAGAAASAAEIERLRNALDCSLAGLWDCELADGRLSFDARAASLLESPDSHQPPTHLAELEQLMHPQDLERWHRRWREHLAGHSERLDAEFRLARGVGRWAWVAWRGRVLAHNARRVPLRLGGVVLDIHQHKQAEEQLGLMAQRDPLTELPNRALLADRMEHALAAARRNRRSLAVLGVRLDGVQAISEALGQEMGDQAIKQAARRMAACTRASDSVARTGNDEFVLLLEDVEGRHDAQAVAEKLQRHVNEPLVADGHWLQLTASIGMAIYPLDGDSVFALLDSASPPPGGVNPPSESSPSPRTTE